MRLLASVRFFGRGRGYQTDGGGVQGRIPNILRERKVRNATRKQIGKEGDVYGWRAHCAQRKKIPR